MESLLRTCNDASAGFGAHTQKFRVGPVFSFVIYVSNSMRIRKSAVGIHLLGIGLACLAATQLSGSNKNANRRKPSAVLFGIGHRWRLGMRHEGS